MAPQIAATILAIYSAQHALHYISAVPTQHLAKQCRNGLMLTRSYSEQQVSMLLYVAELWVVESTAKLGLPDNSFIKSGNQTYV